MEDLAAPTRFIATHYALLGLLALISYAVGFRLTRRLVYHSLWEEISVCLGLGLGALAYLVFLLALVGVLYRPVVLLALAGLTLAAYPAWLQLARRTIWAAKRLRRSTIGVALFVLALSLPILLLPLYPPTLWDATSYHLAAAKIYVEHHQLVFTPNLRFPVFTQLNEMLFTLALLLSDDILAHLLEGLLLFTLLAALIGFGARFFSPRSGWWAAALLLANPLVLLLGSVAYVDIGLTLFATLAVFSFWTWLHTRQQLWLLLAAGFCGFALSTKYPALFFFAVFSLITLAVSWRRHQFLPVVLFGAIPLLIAAPWYIRIWYYTGNPVFPFFPFFYDIFGHRLWPADYVTGMLSDHSIYGTGKSLGALLMLPWNLAFKQEAFFGEGSFSPLYFFALPLLVIFGVLSSHIRALLLLVITYTLFWFFGPQVLRYLLPALPLLSLATAAALDCLLHWLPHSGRHVCQPFLQVLSRSSFKWSGQRFNALWHVKQPLLIGLVFLLLLAPGWHFAVEQVRRRGLPPMTDTQRDAYLTQQLGQTYLAYKFLNELKGQHYTVYALNDEGLVYFADGTHIGDCLGPARYSLVMIRLPDADGTPPPGECDPNRYKRSSYNKLVDGRTLYDRLKALGTDYFLVNQLFERVELPDDDFFHSHFKLIYARSKVLLFELTTEPWEYKPGPELLQNASFEALDQGQPIGWGRAGSPLIEGSGQHSHSGAVAVRSDGPENVLYQAVPVKPNRSYRLSFYARAESKGQQTRLQVNWADAQGKFLATNIEVAAVGLDWRRYELYVQVPERAAFAEIYASPHEGSSVWYDDFSFIEITYSPPGPAVQRKLGPELLVNPGFEILVGGEHPAAWRRVGTPTVDASGQHSHTGKVAVHAVGAPTVTAPAGPAAVRSLNVDNLLYQLVGVRPGATYTLRLYARADAPDQQVRLHITWVDIQGSLLATNDQVAAASADWQQYELEAEAPPRAAYAIISTSPQAGSSVWFDDFSFVEVTYEPKPPGP